MANKTKRLIAVALFLCLVFMVIPMTVQAGGTTPSSSGSYTNKFWGDYGTVGRHADFKARVDKLSSETDTTYDYYEVVNYFKQTSPANMMDYPNWWTYVGQPTSSAPTEPDWDPGTRSTGTSPTSFDIGVSSSGFSASMSWDNHWCGDWRIADRSSQTTNDGYTYFGHQEWFEVGFCGDGREHEWDTLTHGTAWKVRQNSAVRIYAAGAIAYCDAGWWTCAFWHAGPNEWDAAETSLIWESTTQEGCLSAQQVGNVIDDVTINCQRSPEHILPVLSELQRPAIDRCGNYATWADCNPSTPDDPEYFIQRDLNALT